MTLIASVSVLQPSAAAPASTPLYFIDNVRMFDGEAVSPDIDVLIADGVIAAVGTNLTPPAEAEVVAGEGKTLIPGLIDSHAHPLTVNQLRESLLFGVTSVLGQHEPLAVTQFQQCAGPSADRAFLFPATAAATAEGGHAEPGRPTISSPSEAPQFVADRIAEGAHHIKIIREDLTLWGSPTPVPQVSNEVVRAVAQAAHDQGKLAVAHVTKRSDAHKVLRAGVDGLAHMPVDEPAGPRLRRLLLENDAFVVPTLAVEQTADGAVFGQEPLDDPLLSPWLTPSAQATLQ
ncbi:amidohydrolase family protein, partial [Streptomyces cinereoruber]|uniref:amidohydrolase family protein n=1 Tax=Streptomyces cinereoruber TaxID=67260 RepID=UPI003624C23D